MFFTATMDEVKSERHENVKPKLSRGFSLRRRKSSPGKKSRPHAVENKLKPAAASDPITIPAPKSSLDKLTKRKESGSPGLPKKKPLRKLNLSFKSGSSQFGASQFYTNDISESIPNAQSAFEAELSDQENQSPNDPEFVRRASFRWKQKNGLRQSDKCGVVRADNYYAKIPTATYSTSLQWFKGTGQQNSSQKSRSRTLVESHSISDISTLQTLKLGSGGEPCPSNTYHVDAPICPKPRKMSIRRSSKKKTTSESAKKLLPKSMTMDDSLAEAVLTQARKSRQLGSQTTVDGSTVSNLLNHFSIDRQKLSGSLKRSALLDSRNYVSGSADSQDNSCCSAPTARGLTYSSKSYHCGLDLCNSPDASPSPSQLHFEDIFVTEPAIAEKFAIMFPTEPRPEWHRHLRQVLHKAGQKIFKKPEYHDTTIPENLRYQLKQIYVY